MEFLIAGYYGYRNWGDEGALATLLQVLPREAVGVLSGDPVFTESAYGVCAVPRMHWRAVRSAIQRSHALIFGGGSLLQDATSLRSLVYYLTLIQWGLRAHGRVLLVGQGVGPLRRPLSRWLVARILRRVPLISLRDEESANLLRQLGVANSRVDADLTWALQPQSPHIALEANARWVGLAPRTWGSAPVHAMFAALCQYLQQRGYRPLLIPMQETQDRALCEAIAATSNAAVAPPPQHPAQLMGLMHTLTGMVAMRLHGAIFAAAQGVPVLAISYDPKVDALAKQLGMPCLALAVAPASLTEACEAFLQQRNALQQRLLDATPLLRQKAEQLLAQVITAAGLP